MKTPSLAKGSYVMIVYLPEDTMLTVGGLGELQFARGYYAYVGSAMGGLVPRLRRHLSKKKMVRWHIDYLTVKGTVRSVFICHGGTRLECTLAQDLSNLLPSTPHFGSGDCDCPSHLFFAASKETVYRDVETVVASLNVTWDLVTRPDLSRHLNAGRS
jgi:Uri superfamily endonuclease